jgi:acyl-CoA thioester hydrolase
VNNVKYFEYFQEARIVYMTRLWAGITEGTREVPMVLAQMDVDYRVPILFRPEPYDVDSWVSRVGTSSFVIESEIRDGERLLSRARVVMVTFDPATQRAAPAPEDYRRLLQRHLTPAS